MRDTTHPACWLCGFPNGLCARTCGNCGRQVWRDRIFDLVLWLVSASLFLFLLHRGVEVQIP